jgi:hypothetical protein
MVYRFTALFTVRKCHWSELLGFWSLTVFRYTKSYRTQRFGNRICFRPQVSRGTPTLLGSLEVAARSKT